MVRRAVPFVGLRHFVELLTGDRDFLISFKNTIAFAVLTTLIVLLLAFFITVLMDRRRIVGVGLLQSAMFLPFVVSVVPSAIIWKWMYDPQYGIFNYLLSFFGIRTVGWLTDHRFAMFAIVLFYVWRWLGYYMVIFWVGLKGIPGLYVEAARADGASDWKITTRILLPLLRPIVLFSLVIATINGFTIFSEVYVMTVGNQAAPGNMVKTLTYDIYERAFVYFKVGQGNAEAMILFLIVIMLSILQIKLVRKGELY